jgi:pyruvate-formate lyase
MSITDTCASRVTLPDTVVRLSQPTRDLACRALGGESGRSMQAATFALHPEQTKGLSPNRHYALAALEIAQRAPIRIFPGERIVGAATLLEAVQHKMPLTPFSSTSHTTPAFDLGLQIGYHGIRQQIEHRLAQATLDDNQRDLLQSMLICLDAARLWQDRNLAAVEQLAREAEDPCQQQDLQTVAAILRRVPDAPPATFREAVQSLWSLFAFQRLCGNWCGIGRIDKMLGGYLQRDLAEGRLTLDDARELLAHFWIKGCEWIGNPHVWGSGDAQYYQNIVLGGVDAAGHAILNEVTWLVLDIVEELHISDFPIAARVNRHSPEPLLRRIAQVQRQGGGIVAIYNEDVILPALERFGYTREEARDFANDGCWEIILPGKTAFSYCPFDTLKVLQDSIGLPDQGPAAGFDSFESLYSAFRAGLSQQLDTVHRGIDGAFQGGPPAPLLSLLVEGCIETGRGYHDRGARYTVMAPHAGGLADTANSLYVIKKAVFDDQLVTWPTLLAAIRANWQDQEPLRRQLAGRYELYGNDQPEADAMLRRVYDDYVEIASQTPRRSGVLRPPGISTFGREIAWRKHRLATAFGRRCGEILATNLAPTPGTDKGGPTAVIKSFCSLDFLKLPNGVPLELKILPSTLRGETGTQALVALMRSFVELGGVFLHIDVVDSELLRAAQREPEKYPNLAVRISGWSARFATLDRNWQDMIIQRTQQRF